MRGSCGRGFTELTNIGGCCARSPLLQRWRVHVLMDVAFTYYRHEGLGTPGGKPTRARSTILPPKSVSVTPGRVILFPVAAAHGLE